MDNISITVHAYDGEKWYKKSHFTCRTTSKTNSGFCNAIKKKLVGGVSVVDKDSIAIASGFVQETRWKGVFYYGLDGKFKCAAFANPAHKGLNPMSQVYLDMLEQEDREAHMYMNAAKAVVQNRY